ncbi:MAG: transcriptional repressor NrdR [Betaproteobacteria bacterium]|nr:transcriptional repressor NrdR [Betaproteobacteria bacterium]
MRCPFCDGADTQVIDTRNSDEGDSIRRRRRCSHCDKRFTTFERIELNLPVVVKKNGARVEFDRRKLRASIALALRKRPISAEQMDATLMRIENRLMSFGVRELASDRIGELVMRELRKIDKVAYIRFASVYRSFEDVDAFADVIEELRPTPGNEPQALARLGDQHPGFTDAS